MPQKQKKYEDAMSSVFDFMFEQTQKPPSKVKPVKMTGVDTSSEVMEAISAVLESPLIFVNQSMIEAFEDVTDVNLVRMQLGSRKTDKVDINLRTAGDFLRDPDKFVDKAFARMDTMRKMQRVNIFGEEMRGVVAGVWAKKRGLDSATQAAMLGVGRNIKGSYIDSEKTGVVERSRQILETNFGPKGSPTRGFISTKVPKKTVESMLPHLKVMPGDSPETIKRKSGAIKDIQDQYEGLVKGHITGTDDGYKDNLLNPDLYTLLEGKELLHKAYTAPTNDQKYGYMAAARYVANSNQLGAVKGKEWVPRMRNFIDQSKDKRKDYQKKIKSLRGTPGSSAQIDAYKKAIKQIDEDITFAKRMDFGEKIGNIEGGWYTIKDYVVDGNLLPSLINGNFFDPRKNAIAWLQPSREVDVTFGFKNVKQDDGTFKMVPQKIKAHFGKERDNVFLDTYAKGMNEVYYMSPATWVRSLMTGEIFAYRLSKARKKFKGKMEKVLSGFSLNDSVLSGIYENQADILKFMSGGLTPSEMKKIYSALPPELQAILKNKKARDMFKKFVKDNKKLTNLTKVFSFVGRKMDDLQEYLNKKVFSQLRDVLGRALLKKITDVGARELIENWVAKGGIKTLIKGIVTSIMTAAGVVTTGGGGAIIGAITWIATEVVMIVTKPVLKAFGKGLKLYLQLVGFAMLGVIGVMIIFFSFFYLLVFGKHSHVAPNQVVLSQNWEAMGWEPVDNEGGDSSGDFESQFVPGNLPAGQQCLFQLGPGLRCTQGPYSSCNQPGYLQPSHSKSPAIDVAIGGGFHAPQFCDIGKANCKIVAVGNGTCGGGAYDAGGYVMFSADYEGRTYEFYILHVDYDTSLTAGRLLGPGQKVADIVHKAAWQNCSTGLHAHVSTKINGGFVNPEPLFNQDFQC